MYSQTLQQPLKINNSDDDNDRWSGGGGGGVVLFQFKMASLSYRPIRAPPLSQQFPKVALETVPMFVWLNTDRFGPRTFVWFRTSKSGMSATSFLHSSFLQVINSVVLWPVRVQKVTQASEHLCPTKLKTTYDIWCACQSVCSLPLTLPCPEQ